MAYIDSNTNWSFNIPQAGETDSVQAFKAHMEAIDAALLTPDNKAQLTGRGASDSTITDATYVLDAYQTSLAGENVYVTKLHAHPTPTRVPLADLATNATHATNADNATQATKLSTTHTINGHSFNGTQNVDVEPDDITKLNRVYYGTTTPANFGGFRTNLHAGDLYVQIYR